MGVDYGHIPVGPMKTENEAMDSVIRCLVGGHACDIADAAVAVRKIRYWQALQKVVEEKYPQLICFATEIRHDMTQEEIRAKCDAPYGEYMGKLTAVKFHNDTI